MLHSHLRRLERVWILNPIFFVSTNTNGRRKILANEKVVSILVDEWSSSSRRHGWYVGQYVVMPDHVHFFCSSGSSGKSLSSFMKCWKEWTSKRIINECGIDGNVWQREFFDHVIRNEASYAQKKEYVLNNPVKAGFVKYAEDWNWKGEIEQL